MAALLCIGCGFHAVTGKDGGSGDLGSEPSGDLAGVGELGDMATTLPTGDGGTSVPWQWQTETPTSELLALRALWASAANDVYLVGEAGFISHSMGDGNWSLTQSTDANNLYAITGTAGALAVTGDNGDVQRSTGDGSWITGNSGTGAGLRGAWLQGQELILVGAHGTYVDTVGNGAPNVKSWPGMSGSWLAVWAAGQDVYVVGEGGQILRRKAGQWAATPLGSSLTLTAVWGASASDIYAVGQGGAIYHSTGQDDWSTQHNGDSHDLAGVFGSSGTDLWAVGAGGTMLHSTGDGNWAVVKMPTHYDLYGVWSDGSETYAVGAQATVLHGRRQPSASRTFRAGRSGGAS